MVKHTQTIRRQFDHFVELALKGLSYCPLGNYNLLGLERNLKKHRNKCIFIGEKFFSI